MSLKNSLTKIEISYGSINEIDVDVYHSQLQQEKQPPISRVEENFEKGEDGGFLTQHFQEPSSSIYVPLYERNIGENEKNFRESQDTIENILYQQPTPLVNQNSNLENRLNYVPWHIREGRTSVNYPISQTNFTPLPYYRRR